MYLLLGLVIIIPSSVISSQKLHALAVLLPTFLCCAITLVHDILVDTKKYVNKYVVLLLYGYLWAVHFAIARQLF